MQISQDTINRMESGDQAEFQIWTELLESRGYKLLVEFLQGNAESVHAILQNPNSWDEHLYNRGRRDALLQVLNLEAILEARVAEIDAESEETFEDYEVELEL